MGQPDAVVDLRTHAGVALVKTEWRYSDAQIVDIDFNVPGPQGDDPLKLYAPARCCRQMISCPRPARPILMTLAGKCSIRPPSKQGGPTVRFVSAGIEST